MSKSISILDKDYAQWVEDLSVRYRQSQIRASVKVNRELLRYYWELGRDIEEMHVEERWGQGIIKNLSADLQQRNPNATSLSRTNIYYAKRRIVCRLNTHWNQVASLWAFLNMTLKNSIRRRWKVPYLQLRRLKQN